MTPFVSALGTLGDAVVDRVFRVTHAPAGLAHVDPAPTPATIARAIALGLDFLAKCQRRDGAWVDFLLPPGASVEWITAHIAFVLENVGDARGMTTRAADYLASVGPNAGGWGYSQRVATDCDSTAQALMVLHTHGIEPPGFIVDRLLAAQTPSAGFPTYAPRDGRPTNGWQREHPDVTLMVVEAIRRLGIEPARRERAVLWLQSSTTEALVRSYWWPSPAYAAWLQSRVDHRAADASREAVSLLQRTHSTPSLAMLLAATRLTESSTAERSLTTLLGQQLSDGSWPCAPVLRVTDPRNRDGSAGPVFAGTRRAFSTAHAVAAIERFERSNRECNLVPAPRNGSQCSVHAR